ncbi:hypothetical protein WS68_01115 [Burkholderia sp. TSV86]|nr:hypothetical protein WS68_01115 [Burkholderia sp. TSV86]
MARRHPRDFHSQRVMCTGISVIAAVACLHAARAIAQYEARIGYPATLSGRLCRHARGPAEQPAGDFRRGSAGRSAIRAANKLNRSARREHAWRRIPRARRASAAARGTMRASAGNASAGA